MKKGFTMIAREMLWYAGLPGYAAQELGRVGKPPNRQEAPYIAASARIINSTVVIAEFDMVDFFPVSR
jgi:hypothetical protein